MTINLASFRRLDQAVSSSQLRRLTKESIWIVLGQVGAMLGALASVRLLSELLDPLAYGELALALTVTGLLNQTLFGPLSNAATRYFGPAVDSGEFGCYLDAVRTLAMRVACLVGLLALVILVLLERSSFQGWSVLVVLAVAFAVVGGCNGILNGMQTAARHRSLVALHQGVETWVRAVLAAVVVQCVGMTSAAAMGGYLGASVLVLLSQSWFFKRKLPPVSTEMKSGGIWRSKLWSFCWPMTAYGSFTWAQIASDRWALGTLASREDVGLYAVLFQLGYYPVTMATTAITQLATPILYQMAGDNNDDARTNRTTNAVYALTASALVMTALAFCFTALLHGPIFQLLAAKSYGHVSSLLPWMILAGGIFAAGQTLSFSLLSKNMTRRLIAPKVGTAVVGVVMNVLGAMYWGMPGVVGAAVAFSSLYFLWMMGLTWRRKVSHDPVQVLQRAEP